MESDDSKTGLQEDSPSTVRIDGLVLLLIGAAIAGLGLLGLFLGGRDVSGKTFLSGVVIAFGGVLRVIIGRDVKQILDRKWDSWHSGQKGLVGCSFTLAVVIIAVSRMLWNT